jgi:hypothetical protein
MRKYRVLRSSYGFFILIDSLRIDHTLTIIFIYFRPKVDSTIPVLRSIFLFLLVNLHIILFLLILSIVLYLLNQILILVNWFKLLNNFQYFFRNTFLFELLGFDLHLARLLSAFIMLYIPYATNLQVSHLPHLKVSFLRSQIGNFIVVHVHPF